MRRNITKVETPRNTTAPTTPPAMAPTFVFDWLLVFALPEEEEVVADELDPVGVEPALVGSEEAEDSGRSPADCASFALNVPAAVTF